MNRYTCVLPSSAADLYITKHLDSYLRKSGNSNVLCRVMQPERRLHTVPQEVKKYCLLTSAGTAFRLPTKMDIEKYRVVIVTVTSSLELTK